MARFRNYSRFLLPGDQKVRKLFFRKAVVISPCTDQRYFQPYITPVCRQLTEQTLQEMPKRKAEPSSKSQSQNGSDSEAIKKKQSKMSSFIKVGDAKKSEGSTNEPNGPLKLSNLIKSSDWKEKLASEFSKKYFTEIEDFLTNEYAKGKEIFPPKNQVFNTFNLTPLESVKVVILGQDPYHDNNQAHGLCFSVQRGVAVPPSLKNIYKELITDIPGFKAPSHGFLNDWAKQGILLLNATLTVEAHKANSHSEIGWQNFSDAAIKVVSDSCDGVIFILWGGFAQKKEKLIDQTKHTVIKAAHPSPLSVTKFLGCKCFSQTNEALKKYKKAPIDWTIKY